MLNLTGGLLINNINPITCKSTLAEIWESRHTAFYQRENVYLDTALNSIVKQAITVSLKKKKIMNRDLDPTLTFHSSITQKKTSPSILQKFASWPLLTLLFLLPIIVVPFTNNFIFQSKLFLTLFVSLIFGLLFLISSSQQKSWRIILSPVTVPLILFSLATAASTFLTQTYPVENLLGMGGIYIAFGIISLLGASLIKNKNIEDKFITTFNLSSVILTVSGLLQLIGFGPSKLISLITGFQLPNNLIFNLSGSSFTAVQILALNLVAIIAQVVKKRYLSSINLISAPIIIAGLLIFGWSLLPGKQTPLTLPSLSASWSVGLDSLRSPKTALVGQGTDAYQNVYTIFRPIWTNGKTYWQTNFSRAANLPLTLIVTHGLLGTLAWIFLMLQFFRKKNLIASKDSALTWVIAAVFMMQLLFPPNAVLLIIQAIALAFWMANFRKQFPSLELEALNMTVSVKKQNQQDKTPSINNLMILIVNSLLGLALCFLLFLTARAYLSFHQLYLANKAFLQNDAVKTYEEQAKAVSLNPYLDTTRREYALTNLKIATALSNKADLTEQETNQMLQLLQQAVREAKAATILDPMDVNNQLILAQVYRAIAPINEEALQLAVSSYLRAIETYPSNPLLRVELASLLMSQEQYNQAINLYQQAINLKPDLPIAYYQISLPLINLNRLSEAKMALEQALLLLPQDSEDYGVVQKDLATIDKKIKEASDSAQVQDAASAQTEQSRKQGAGSEQMPSLIEQSVQNPNQQVLNQAADQALEGAEDIDLIEEETEQDPYQLPTN
ncbi:MAG: tetratricopeptide repeat protein [Candidatus Woesebacteria bacterium]|jgi:tetratricopeptide (TPR) repeat protein